jgi:hypothetical protein
VGCNSSLSWAVHRQLLIVAQRAGVAPAADWAAYMQDIEPQAVRGVLVIAIGTKLTPSQRADVERFNKSKQAGSAVLTDSVVTRGVVTALSWFGVPIKAFAPSQLASALEFLSVPSDQRQETAAVVERVRRALESRKPSPAARN